MPVLKDVARGDKAMGPGERAFAEVAVALGLSYVAEPDRLCESPLTATGSFVRRGWVMLVNPASAKRRKKASLLFPDGNVHSCTLGDEHSMAMYGRVFSEDCPERPLDGVFRDALAVLMRGGSLKVSKNRSVRLPEASSVEEFLLKLSASAAV